MTDDAKPLIAELEKLNDNLIAQRDTYRQNNRWLVEQARQLRRERNAAASAASSGFWVWSDTDSNDLESLCADALVSLTAGQLRALLAGPEARPVAQSAIVEAVREHVAEGVRQRSDPRLDGMASSQPGLRLAPALALAEREYVRGLHPTPWTAGIGGQDANTGFIDDARGNPVDFDNAIVCRHVARLVNGNAAGVEARRAAREEPTQASPERNAEATDAILEAERLLDDAIRAHVRVADAERAIHKAEEHGDLERSIAAAGEVQARVKVDVLRALRGRALPVDTEGQRVRERCVRCDLIINGRMYGESCVDSDGPDPGGHRFVPAPKPDGTG